MRDRVWSDILGAGLETTRLPLLYVPGEFVDELILNLRIRCRGYCEPTHISLAGSRWPHDTVLQDGTVTTSLDYNTHTMIMSSLCALNLPSNPDMMLLAGLSTLDAVGGRRWSGVGGFQAPNQPNFKT